MTLNSFQESLQLVNIMAGDPLWAAIPLGYRENLAFRVSQWGQEKQANGGYTSCSLTLSGSKDFILEWIANGIGRDIQVLDDNLLPCWEGFVNRVTANLGPETITIGPLVEVANRIAISYTRITNAGTNPPTTGAQVISIIQEDTPSIEKYGKKMRILAGGNLCDATTVNGPGDEVTQVKNAALQILKSPPSTRGMIYGDPGQINLTLECVGYKSVFDDFFFSSTASGYVTKTARVLAIRTAEPNGIISADVSQVETNASLTFANDYRQASVILDEISSSGDASYNRWIWGMQEDKKLYYRAVSTTYDYIIRRGVVYDLNNQIVRPWQIDAGKWAYVEEAYNQFPAGSVVNREDPFSVFIEAVNFTLPYSANISSAPIQNFRQLLIQKGIGIN